uniref:Uncharacterized protein n=1 Tax=Rhizophora mucronata TaxID=61149 RepID=A0A2P2NBE3_RHIMU
MSNFLWFQRMICRVCSLWGMKA